MAGLPTELPYLLIGESILAVRIELSGFRILRSLFRRGKWGTVTGSFLFWRLWRKGKRGGL